MSAAIRLSLRPGERVFVNGAVLRVDRKVTVELLNDATFLLETHVLQPEQATTPLRQLYFAVQSILIDPEHARRAHAFYETQHDLTMRALANPELRAGLAEVRALVGAERSFEALKVLRGLFPAEAALLGRPTDPPPRPARRPAAPAARQP